MPLGEKLEIIKYVGYGWSSTRSRPAVHDQVAAALALARLTGWDQLLAEQRAFLDDFWAGADVEVTGDPEIQQAVRFALFQVLQSGARAEERPIAAKGLTGPGYDGHTFWDTETFVLPVLTHTQPGAAADVLRWRHSVLPLARERAADLGLKGAAFPWRTIDGEECSGYGRPAPPPSTSTRISRTRSSATSMPPGMRSSSTRSGWNCWRSPRGCGAVSATTTPREVRIDGVTGPDDTAP